MMCCTAIINLVADVKIQRINNSVAKTHINQKYKNR